MTQNCVPSWITDVVLGISSIKFIYVTLFFPFFKKIAYWHIFRKDHEKAEFEVHEVYAVDVLVSTGEGKVSALMSPLNS